MPSSHRTIAPCEMTAEISFYIGRLENGRLGDLGYRSYLDFLREQMKIRGTGEIESSRAIGELVKDYVVEDPLADLPRRAISSSMSRRQ